MNLDSTIALNYIDKVWITLQNVNKNINRVVFLQTILSYIFILLSFDFVSIKKEYVLFGMSFIITPWLPFLIGIFILITLFVYMITLVAYGKSLRVEVTNQYEKLDRKISLYIDHSLISYLRIMFENLEKAETLKEKIIAYPFIFLAICLYLLLPVFTILILNVKLLLLLHVNYLIGLIAIIISLYIPFTGLSFFVLFDDKKVN